MRTFLLVSIVALSICIPTTVCVRSFCLHLCQHLPFHLSTVPPWQMWGSIPFWFWFAFIPVFHFLPLSSYSWCSVLTVEQGCVNISPLLAGLMLGFVIWGALETFMSRCTFCSSCFMFLATFHSAYLSKFQGHPSAWFLVAPINIPGQLPSMSENCRKTQTMSSTWGTILHSSV